MGKGAGKADKAGRAAMASKGRRVFDLEVAREAATDVQQWLSTICTRTKAVGSVRREKPRVHDLDLLIIPVHGADLDGHLAELGFRELIHPRELEPKLKRFVHCGTGVPVKLHLASSMAEWWTMLVVTTGSREFVKKLHAAADKQRVILHDDGKGVEQRWNGKTVQPRSELGVFRLLGMAYVPPAERG